MVRPLGYYGSQEGSIALTESSAAVDGFTHQLCKDWESEAQRLERIGWTGNLRRSVLRALAVGSVCYVLD